MENVTLQIHNYKPSAKQNKEIENRLEFLMRQIPCKSCVTVDFEYKDKVFYGKLKVVFNGKSFFSKGKDVLLSPLTMTLSKKLQKQVMKWKKSRTTEEITGIIVLNPSREKNNVKLYPYDKVG